MQISAGLLVQVLEFLLHGKAFATSTGTRCIRINELKALSIEAIAKIQRGAGQIKKTLFIYKNLNASVFKNMIVRQGGIVKIEVVH